MADSIKSTVKKHLDGMCVASDCYDTLNEDVAKLLEDATQRSTANNRKTVQSRDL